MTEINSVTTLTHDGDVAIVTLNSPPVNALSANVRNGLFEGFKQAIASDAKAIVLICEGRTFIAGADISEFGAAAATPSASPAGGPPLVWAGAPGRCAPAIPPPREVP